MWKQTGDPWEVRDPEKQSDFHILTSNMKSGDHPIPMSETWGKELIEYWKQNQQKNLMRSNVSKVIESRLYNCVLRTVYMYI